MNIRGHSFFTFISDNLQPPLLDLVPRLGCELEKMTSYAQKYLTGGNYNNNKYRKLHEEQQKRWTCSSCNFLYYCYYNFNPSGIFVHIPSFSVIHNQALEHSTRSNNGGLKFSKKILLITTQKLLAKFSHLKKLESKISNPKKSLNHPYHLKSGVLRPWDYNYCNTLYKSFITDVFLTVSL